MGLSCRLEPPMLKQVRIQVYSDISHEQNHKYPYECFLNPRINKPFTVNQEFLSFKAN